MTGSGERNEKGRFVAGNKAALGVKRSESNAQSRKYRQALSEQFTIERRIQIREDALVYAYKFAEKYESPKMLLLFDSRLSDELDGRPTQRVETGNIVTPQDWLAAMADDDAQGNE